MFYSVFHVGSVKIIVRVKRSARSYRPFLTIFNIFLIQGGFLVLFKVKTILRLYRSGMAHIYRLSSSEF